MTNEYTKSVDELAKRKTHPQSLPVYTHRMLGRAQLRAQADANARRQLIKALAVAVVAAVCIGFAVYRIARAVWS